jgi:hypothetical protein
MKEEKKFTYNNMLNFAQHLMTNLLATKDENGVSEISSENLTKIQNELDKFVGHETNEPVLAKGTKVYIPTSLHVYRGKDDIQGGLATVKTIDYSEHLSPDHYNYIMVSFEELPQGKRYNWRYLLEHQKEWEKEYKGLIAKPDPDYRPEFNCDDSDWH